MSEPHDPRLCYDKKADDPLRVYYCDPGCSLLEVPNASAVASRFLSPDWAKKLGALHAFFKTNHMIEDAASVYDVRYRGKPNASELYDILFLPNVHRTAMKLTLAVKQSSISKLDWSVFMSKAFSPIEPSLYLQRFLILKEDLPAIRLSYIDILKDRLTPPVFDAWLEETRFN